MNVKHGLPALAAGTFLFATVSFAHHRIADYYDPAKPVVLRGAVREFIRANPHSFILLDIKSDSGAGDTWAVEGDGPNNLVAAGWDLRSSGWNLDMLTRGQTIGVTVLAPRAGAKLAATIVIDEARMPPVLQAAMKRVAEIGKAGRLVHGLDVTLPDGRKLLFGEAGR